MMPKVTRKPLSRKELAELARFLRSVPDALPLAGVHGLLTAVSSAPSLIPPSAWLPRATGEAVFDSQEQASQVLGLLMRLYNQTLTELGAGQLTIVGDDRSVWSLGYLAGVALNESWMGELDDLQRTAPMIAVAEWKAPPKVEDPELFLKTCRDNLEGFAVDTFKHFLERRRADIVADAEPVAAPTGPKAGRNEPCPCGSGKKYKKCCGFN